MIEFLIQWSRWEDLCGNCGEPEVALLRSYAINGFLIGPHGPIYSYDAPSGAEKHFFVRNSKSQRSECAKDEHAKDRNIRRKNGSRSRRSFDCVIDGSECGVGGASGCAGGIKRGGGGGTAADGVFGGG